jgi:hypothetical protein
MGKLKKLSDLTLGEIAYLPHGDAGPRIVLWSRDWQPVDSDPAGHCHFEPPGQVWICPDCGWRWPRRTRTPSKRKHWRRTQDARWRRSIRIAKAVGLML